MNCLPSTYALTVIFLLHAASFTRAAVLASRATIPFDMWDYELTINVSLSGNDSLECLAGLLPCQTLGYALTGVENSTAILLDGGEHEFAPSETIMIVSRVRHVALVGEIGRSATRVTCGDGAGVAIVASQDIVIYGVEWRGCAIAHRSSALHHKLGIAFLVTNSALFFHQCLNVTIADCSFSSRNGSGVSLYDVGGEVIVQRTNFTGHAAAAQKCAAVPCYLLSRGLTIEFTYCGDFNNCSEPAPASVYNSGARYSIEDCIFVGNNNSHGGEKPVDSLEEGSEYWPYGKGGGMAIALRGRSRGNVIVMTYTDGFDASSSAFSQNVADLGGSLSVEFLDEASGNNFIWLGPAGVSLSSAEIGGAVHLSVGVWLQRSKGGTNSFLLRDVAITNNRASWGGGFTLFNLPSSDGSTIVSFQNCSWHLNSAKTGADAVGISQLSTTGISGMIIVFSNCNFRENDFVQSAGSVLTYENTPGFTHCSISTDGLALVLDTVTISDSSGPGLCVSAAIVHMKGNVQFVSNGLRTRPVCGGGLLLQSSSSVVLSKGVELLFENNTALYYGGGVYYGGLSTTLPRGGQRYSQSTCVFDYEDALVPVEEWSTSTHVVFSNNQIADSRGAGRGMYLAGVVDDQCKNAMANITKGSPQEDFASTGTSVQLHFPAERIGPNTYKMEVMYGQYLTLNATATDYYDNVVEMMLRLVSLDPKTMQPVLSINGLTSLVVRDGPVYTNTFLQSSNGMSEVYLLLTDLVNTYSFIHISFITRLGFVFDSSRQIYSCFASEHMICNRTTLEVCIQKGYWYGELQMENKTMNTIAPCPPNLCEYTGNRCNAACDDINSFCLLSGNQDNQCTNNRGGVLCSKCRHNYSFTFDATQCVPSQTCSALHTLLFTVCIVLFWVAIGAFTMMILKLNMKLGAGCTFSFIYYFSVVRVVLPTDLPSLFLTVFVDLISGTTQMNPRFLGLVQWCAFDSLSTLGYWMVRYLHPFVFLFLMSIVSILKCGHERFPCLSRIPSVHILCILIVFVFSSLTEISLKLLTPVSIGNRLYVAVEPSVEFFNYTKHLPWAFMAVAVECVLLLPASLLLVSGPLFAKLKCTRDTQLRGILCEYQVCYRKGFKWTVGFYFLARQTMFLVPVLCWSAEASSVYFLQVLTVFLAVFHTALQPYKMAWLNVVDALLLFDLAFVALLNNTGLPSVAKSILLHALVLLPCLYPVVVFAWLGVRNLKSRLKNSGDKFSDDLSFMADKRNSTSSDLSSSQLRYESLIDRQPRKDHYHSISIL